MNKYKSYLSFAMGYCIIAMVIAAFIENIGFVLMNGFLLLFNTFWYFGVDKR